MNNLIAIGGNGVEAGKSTVAKILALLLEQYTDYAILHILNNPPPYFKSIGSYQIKKFADKLKDIVCLMIGKDRHWLEENKNTLLGDDWKTNKIEYTPRLLMKHIGTTLFRDQLIPDIHVNMLFNEYKTSFIYTDEDVRNLLIKMGYRYFKDECWVEDAINEGFEYREDINLWSFDEDNIKDSNWIIDDLRFKNEYDRVKKYNGVTIYVKRGEDEIDNVEGQLLESDFDYVIDNNGTISDLISKVKKVYDEIQVNYNRKKNY